MIKLKDNIDSNTLDKYGIKKSNIYGVWFPIGRISFDGEDFRGWYEINGYEFIDYEDKFNIDTLYHLIKDELVEEIEEE